MSVNDGTGVNWVESDPADNLVAGGGALELRDLRLGVRQRMQKEHVAPAGSSAGGEHKPGSAIIFNQSSAPTTKPDGSTPLDSNDLGRLWIKTTGEVYVWTGAAWARVLPVAGDIVPAMLAVGSKVQFQAYTGNGGTQTLTFAFAPTMVLIIGSANLSSIGYIAYPGTTIHVPFNGQQIVGAWGDTTHFTFSGDDLTNKNANGYFAIAFA